MKNNDVVSRFISEGNPNAKIVGEGFTGDQKHLKHVLVPYESRIIGALLPRVPRWMETTHLTLMTVLWSAGVVVSGYLARADILWLWAFSAFIFLQYVTDMLDGAIGRARGTGLIKWGFYMDHFLDHMFLCAIVCGYSFLLPPSFMGLVLLGLAAAGGFMVHTFLDFSITGDFKISLGWFGVSEMRHVLIIFNALVVFFGKALLVNIFPFFIALLSVGLCAVVYRSQKLYASVDMAVKRENDSPANEYMAVPAR